MTENTCDNCGNLGCGIHEEPCITCGGTACDSPYSRWEPKIPLVEPGRLDPAILPSGHPDGVTSKPTSVVEQFDRRVLEDMVEKGIRLVEEIHDGMEQGSDREVLRQAVAVFADMQEILHVPAKTVQVRKITEADALRMVMNNVSGNFNPENLQQLLNSDELLRDSLRVRYEVQE